MDILQNLNDKQKEAAITIDGPVLIIAGPGSGKTKVLTHRIAHLIKDKKTNPNSILAVTFTNKAAQEMKDRVGDLLSKTAENFEGSQKIDTNQFASIFSLSSLNLPIIGTFHSICVKILRQEAVNIGYKKDFVIYDDEDQRSVIKKVMTELEMNTDQFNPNMMRSCISNAKNELKTPEEFSSIAEDYFQENASKVYDLYQKKLKDSNALDFDDLIMQTIVLFLSNPVILEKYQKKFKYVMVDEYQDTNHAQYTLVDLLGKSHRNLCVVGDDWQSIYKWRGADIKNILEFEKNYPEAKVVLLERNYRSTQVILDGAYQVIAKNINRKEKKLWTEKKSGNPIVIYEAADEKGEAEFIISELAKLNSGQKEEKIRLKDIAVLYRTNAQSRSIEDAFLRYNVPYKIIGGIKFYMRKEIKDIIAFLRFIQNSNDLSSFERIVNIPQRGIGKVTIGKIFKAVEISRKDTIRTIMEYNENNLTKDKLEKLKAFASLMEDLQKESLNMKMSEFLDYVIKKVKYQKYIQDGTEEGDRRWENVKELFSAIEKYDEFLAREGMERFLEEVALATDLDQMNDKEDSVTLMTLHSAKGLEYDTVFIIGLEEGLLPHSRSLREFSEMEEERRLCYVGITRAKKRVYFTYARLRKIYGSIQSNMPSRFISDIPEELTERKNQGYKYLGDDDFIELD